MKYLAAAQAVLLTVLVATLGCSRSPEEQALGLIQQAGGSIATDDEGRVVSIDLSETPANDEILAAVGVLPYVHTLNCTNAGKITGSTLDQLAGLQSLETLYLVGTGLNDAGLSRMPELRALKTLHLGRTRITDAGMPALDRLANLQTLSLGNTEVTDQGLIQLRDLRKLSTLILRKTRVTPQGVQELQRMLPHTRVEQ